MYDVHIFVDNLVQSIGLSRDCLFDVVNVSTYFAYESVETCEEDMPLIQLLTTEQLSTDTGDDSDFEVPLVHIKNRNRNKEVNEVTETLEEITCLNVSSDSDNAINSEPGDI
ncbi:hypothetical protein PoB_000260500 [Plakobranchus ocellatus]|uniref:Uncharacterized protein n=1 Tax=Plakobranchus ocellatus TaxID=259542 RepID=A0AAV3XZ38_9GAST|nr:hypothetical protein PoB_000260500 [Plakobranchus ocellatus]